MSAESVPPPLSPRVLSTSKMSSRGPVKDEFTLKGSTPSGKPRLFVCNTCTRAFARQEHLSRHERSHTKEKPFTCNICSRKFSRRDLLLRHSTKLHAGAADVIPRLRKRSLKYSKSDDLDELNNTQFQSQSQSQPQQNNTKVSKITKPVSNSHSAVSKVNIENIFPPNDTFKAFTFKSISDSNVNAQKQHHQPDNDQYPPPGAPNASSTSMLPVQQQHPFMPIYPISEIPTSTDFSDITPSVNNQFPPTSFQNHDPSNMHRRASFSAMSGDNYALANPEPYASETVEFSTPQFDNIDEEQEKWLNSYTPGNNIIQQQLDPHENNQHLETAPLTEIQQLDNFMKKSNSQSKVVSGYSFYDESTHPKNNPNSLFYNVSQPNKQDIEKYPENNNPQNTTVLKNLFDKFSKSNNPNNLLDKMNLEQLEQLTQLHKKMDGLLINQNGIPQDSTIAEENLLDGVNKKIRSWQQTLFNQPISDLEKLNELGVSNTYGVPQGYSFYGSASTNDFDLNNSSTNSANILGSYNDQLSSQATISPILLEPAIEQLECDISTKPITDSQYQRLPFKQRKPSRTRKTFETEFTESHLSSYSQALLFTSNMTSLIKKALAEYPFFGTQTPELMGIEQLNLYVDQFINKFLTHHPFIHRSILNEHTIIKDAIDHALNNSLPESQVDIYNNQDLKLIRDETFLENFKVSIVCLPLLVATIGAIVSNKKEDAANLYEISRRCIHVYLESRKKLKSIGTIANQSYNSYTSSPLWLIQSLTLSIVYGLFADEDISLAVIIRQVHALNSLVKSSGINHLPPPESGLHSDFKSFVNYESVIRTIHMIFHVSSLLSTLYNIDPSLKVTDLDIDLPMATLLWDCLNEEEYLKITENFDFHATNYIHVFRQLLSIPQSTIDSRTGLINGSRNFLLDMHVSEFGLVCLQNGLHQLAYYHFRDPPAGLDTNKDEDVYVELDQLRGISTNWNVLVRACVAYNDSTEVFNDCKILNHFLNIKLSSVGTLSKIKESVWLKSFNDINDQYYNCFNYTEEELKDVRFQNELVYLIENSISILKLVFFNKDNSLIGTISPSFDLNNPTLSKLDDIYLRDSVDEYDKFNKINLNVLHRLSIDSQILFDVILVIVKFLINYERFFKMRMRYNHLSNYTFLQHFDLSSSVFLDAADFNAGGDKVLKSFNKVLFKYYLKFFKIFMNLEQFLKHNYNYVDFETGQAYDVLDGLYTNIKNNNDIDIDRVFEESTEKLKLEQDTLNKVVSEELVVLHDSDLIMSELVSFKLPYKFLKIGGFLFGEVYDRNFKFVNFKHLSDVLFHLRIFMESKEEYV